MGGEAAPDAREALLERDDPDALVLLECQVVTLLDERRAGLVEPLGSGLPARGVGLGQRALGEDRGPLELPRATAGTGRDLVALEQGDWVRAILAPEGAGARKRSGHDGLHLSPPDGGVGPVYRLRRVDAKSAHRCAGPRPHAP